LATGAVGAWTAELGADVSAECSVNGLGAGTCDFTNAGWMGGRVCTNIVLKDLGTDEVYTTKRVCSEDVPANETVSRSFQLLIAPASVCKYQAVDVKWSDKCSVEVLSDP
jgi:hypothetical protein